MELYKGLLSKDLQIIREHGSRPHYLSRLLTERPETFKSLKGKMHIQDLLLSFEHFTVHSNEYILLVLSRGEEDLSTILHTLLTVDNVDKKEETQSVLDYSLTKRSKVKRRKRRRGIMLMLKNILLALLALIFKLILKVKSLLFNKRDAMQILKEDLLSKNLSPHLVDKLLEGSSKDEVKSKLENILKIDSTDIVSEILQYNTNEGKSFTIALIGSNGVGKSTTLSKLAFMFLSKGLSVTLIAGDTFRSGAIEQLEVYANKLKTHGRIRIFKRKYGSDESSMVYYALSTINKENNNMHNFDSECSLSSYGTHTVKSCINTNVVLIDTAGRMPTNISLMQSLQKLVSKNTFNKIYLVNEALSGQFDSLTLFDKSISEAGSRLSGLIFTKVDSVESGVGAIFEGTYRTGIPVAFLCTGQRNVDIVIPNKECIINTIITN